MFIHPTSRAGLHFENFNTMAKRMSNENKTQPAGSAIPHGNCAVSNAKTQLSAPAFYA
jgi:hypothetical protein